MHQMKHDRILFQQHRQRIVNVESTLKQSKHPLDVKASRFSMLSTVAGISTDRLSKASKKFPSAQHLHGTRLRDQIAAPLDLKKRVKILHEEIQLKEDNIAKQSVKRAVNLLDGM